MQPNTEGKEYFGCFRWKPNAFSNFNMDEEKLILEVSHYPV
jgi:hypothetical protein